MSDQQRAAMTDMTLTKCFTCDGRGRKDDVDLHTGRWADKECPLCKGSGLVRYRRTSSEATP